MPRSHGHSHRKRNLLDDIGDIVNGVNPGTGNGKEPNNKIEGRGGQGQIEGRDHQTTIVEVVYKTMSATFDGPIAGYSTLTQGNNPSPTSTPQKQPDSTTTTQSTATPKTSSAGSTASPSKADTATTTIPTAIHPSDASDTASTVLAKATGSATPSPSLALDNGQPSTAATASSSSTADAASSGSNGTDSATSAGAKAGIAFGVIGGVLVAGLLVFFLFNRRRRQAQRQQLGGDDEKFQGAMATEPEPIDDMPTRSNPNAPRISLRPVTQFFPNWNLEKRTSKGAAMVLDTAAVGVAVGGENSDRPETSHSNRSANPFGNQAERVPTPISEEDSLQSPRSAVSPASSSNVVVNERVAAQTPLATEGTEVASGAVAGAVAGAAAVVGAGALARKASMRHQNPLKMDFTLPPSFDPVPPSPAGTEFSISSTAPGPVPAHSKSAAAIAAAGGPPNSTVHRVQLDFKPTLEDEMELRAGELVRLLHEYDDGWALVIRLDRSQQGVVPRTCLSTRPVKPRPAQGRPPVNPSGYAMGPNPPQGQRPMTPQSQRPVSPQGMHAGGATASPFRPMMGPRPASRPASPAGPPTGPQGVGRPQSPMGRPMSPAGRPMSPGPRYQGTPTSQPQSPSGMNPSQSLPGPSQMNGAQTSPPGPPAGPVGRKPIPGQAY